MSLWEFAYDELVMKDSIFSLPNNRQQTDLDTVLAHLSLPVRDAGHGRVCHLDAPHYTSFVFLPTDM